MDHEPLDTSDAADTDREAGSDMSDVVAGPIGSAHLVDPSAVEAKGAELDGFPVLAPSTDTNDTTPDGSTGDADAESPA